MEVDEKYLNDWRSDLWPEWLQSQQSEVIELDENLRLDLVPGSEEQIQFFCSQLTELWINKNLAKRTAIRFFANHLFNLGSFDSLKNWIISYKGYFDEENGSNNDNRERACNKALSDLDR